MIHSRTALADIDIAGTTIPAGSPVVLVLAAGSRDPARFRDPDRFDPDRVDNQHLGFGGSIHYCFGAALARTEAQVALPGTRPAAGQPATGHRSAALPAQPDVARPAPPPGHLRRRGPGGGARAGRHRARDPSDDQEAIIVITETISWPVLPVEQWQPTRDTVHLWTQIVGKTRLALEPPLNHWWNSTLYVNEHGLTTSLMPGTGGAEIEFDFTRHELTITTTEGAVRRMRLMPRTVADFYAEYRSHLHDLGIDVVIHSMPNEIADAVPFEADTVHRDYDADAMHRFWLSLVSAHRVMSQFRAGFRGKASPVHFFWGAFDLAATRFSGRPAPRHTADGHPQLPGLGDDRGLQRRGVQLRLLAGRG